MIKETRKKIEDSTTGETKVKNKKNGRMYDGRKKAW